MISRGITRTIVAASILLAILPTSSAFAQKKKKNSTDAYAGLKLREAEFYFTEAEKYYILEDFAKALAYYQRALEVNPENATIHYKIADVLAKNNKQEDLIKAATTIERALSLDKTNKYFYLLAATIYNSMGRFDKAAEVYERMLNQVKDTEDYLYEVAAVYQYSGKVESAIKAYDRAEAFFGINEVSSLQKLRLYIELGKVKEGIAEGEKLIQAYPDEERYIMSFTEVLSQNNMREQAIGYLERFLKNNTEAPEAEMLLAGFYRDTNQEQKARPILQKLFASNTTELSSKLIILGAYNAELNQSRANGLKDDEKAAFVLSLLERLRETNPNDAAVHIVAGDLFLSTGKNREAQREYLLATRGGNMNFEVWENLVYLEMQLEQYDKVIEHSDEALELFPNHSILYYFNGFANMRMHHYREAAMSLEQAKKLAGTNTSLIGEINGLLGDVYNAVKDYVKSDQAYDDALAINPESENVLNNYSYFLAGRRDQLDKAEKMASLLVKNHPDNPSYLDTYAWVLYVRQKYKEARKVIEKAVSTGNANATHFEHYGDILYQLGDVDAAVVQWEKARGLNAKSDILNKKIANRKIYE